MQLSRDLVWLADAPMFIDANLVDRFYDAVVKPETQEGTTTLEITDESVKKLEGKLAAEVDLKPEGMLALIKNIFPSIKGSLEASASGESTKGNNRTIELHPIKTPQRQLVQLALHYFINIPDRLFLVDKPSEAIWRREETIKKVPRQLVFLNLPGQLEIEEGMTETKIIPVAAEFDNGKVIPLFSLFKDQNGSPPPDYPDTGTIADVVRARKAYWAWFDTNFKAAEAVKIVEDAATAEKSKIRWIDYRVPITPDGDTMHLHICPSGGYDTGVFAFNLIRRGYEHGLRLVGTMKSGLDMNVLAIYDK